MKRLLLLFLTATLLLSLLVGCEKQIASADGFSASVFTEFLDREHIVPGIGQGDFLDQLGKYHYQGESIAPSLSGYFYDGTCGGGYRAGGKQFGLVNDYYVAPESDRATYTNQFYTCVPLDGMQLPYEISFSDTPETALDKLGIVIDSDISLCSYEKAILYREDNAALQWSKLSSEEYSCMLQYTQTYQITRKSGKIADVTRHMAFYFLTQNDQLGKVELSVKENYLVGN